MELVSYFMFNYIMEFSSVYVLKSVTMYKILLALLCVSNILPPIMSNIIATEVAG
jgi:type IV secretory pathway TrbL component